MVVESPRLKALLVPMKTILLVEDDEFVAALSEAFLRQHFLVMTAHTAREAVAIVSKSPPDLVLLDLGLPDEDGLVLARQLRARSAELPIIYVTSRASKEDVLVGLELGGDDYVTKPFDPDLLLARINAVLRRSLGTKEHTSRISIGKEHIRLELDIEQRRAWTTEDVEISFTRAEFDILLALVGAKGRILSRPQLLDAISSGSDHDVDERVVDALVSKIRRKLNAAGLPTVPVETVRGIGYRIAMG